MDSRNRTVELVPDAAEPVPSADAPVVCVCGSMRFHNEMLLAERAETLAGRIVLVPCAFSQTESESFGEGQLAFLRDLHRRKIDMAQEVLIIDVDGYVGAATADEIAYAQSVGKPVRYWSHEEPGGGSGGVR